MSVEKVINVDNKQSKDNFIFRYAIVIEYNGHNFAGSQIQPRQRTVQSELERVLGIITKVKISTIFSGRTDKGVHSQGQVVHFDLPIQIDTFRFLYSLNALLPEDISVSNITQVDKKFHSQKSALYRWYRYQIYNQQQRSVWKKEMLQIHSFLNIEEMNKALSLIQGNHDFSAFKKTNSTNPYTDCTIYHAKCEKENDVINIDLVANRFLYNMVRIIVGTLVEIGLGNQSADYMLDVLNSKNRQNAGKTVQPNGLTFMYVGYNKEYNIYNGLNKEAIYNENLLCEAS